MKIWYLNVDSKVESWFIDCGFSDWESNLLRSGCRITNLDTGERFRLPPHRILRIDL